LDGSETLEERFAKIDSRMVLDNLDAEKTQSDRIRPEMKKIIRLPNLPARLTELLAAQQYQCQPLFAIIVRRPMQKPLISRAGSMLVQRDSEQASRMRPARSNQFNLLKSYGIEYGVRASPTGTIKTTTVYCLGDDRQSL